MAYDLHGLFNRISHHLRRAPYLQLEEISQLVNVERHTIEKAVKTATGMTFREFRTSMLLEQAMRLLDDNPAQSIKEVAFTLGYNSQRSFCRFIRTAAGCSPKELRGRRKLAKGAVA
jgi:AraC-like DNA-binding protein